MAHQELITLLKESDKNNSYLSINKLIEYLINSQLQKYLNEGKCNEFVELYNIKNIELKLIIDYYNYLSQNIFNNVPAMKILIDNYENIKVQENCSQKLIHIICRRCITIPEVIKYMIDKGIDLECETFLRWRPIHYICYFGTSELIKYIIDKNENMSFVCETTSFKNPIQYIVNSHVRAEIIKYIICKDLDYKPLLALLHRNEL
jgi:hypothetical protein